MLKELRSGAKVVGMKQLRRAIRENRVRQVFLAADADPMMTAPLRALCREAEVPVTDVPTMRELGQACGISVGASSAGLLRQTP